MQISHQDHPGCRIVTVEETRIDASVAIAFKDRMREMTEGGPAHTVLDLQMVEFIDSSGLGAIVAAMKQLGQGRHLELASLSSSVEKVFRLTRMDSVFTIHSDAQSAVQAHAA